MCSPIGLRVVTVPVPHLYPCRRLLFVLSPRSFAIDNNERVESLSHSFWMAIVYNVFFYEVNASILSCENWRVCIGDNTKSSRIMQHARTPLNSYIGKGLRLSSYSLYSTRAHLAAPHSAV